MPAVELNEHFDAWVSAETGIGTASDKRTSHHFHRRHLSYEEIARLWEQDAIAAKAIEAPGAEAYREGYELTIADEGSYDDLKESVEEKLEALELDTSLERAFQLKRAFGGAVVLLGADDGRPMDQPLDEARVKALDWLNVLEPIEIYPVTEYDDPGKAKYGKPQLFEINTNRRRGLLPGHASKAPTIKPGSLVHESRLIVLNGIRVSDYALHAGNDISPFWGSSVIPRFIDALRDYGVAYSGAGLLPVDVAQPVIAIENLKEMLAKRKEELRIRMRNIEISRSVARAVLIDKNERYERQTTQLAGIPELLDRLSQRLAGEVDQPLSVLIGYSPASLGAPDDKEMTIWHNRVRSIQRRELTPPTKRVVRMVMRTIRQRRLPKRWSIEWCPLEHMTTAQRAETERVQAQTDNLAIKGGVVYPEEIRRSRYKGGYSHRTQIDEKKPAPGFMAPLPAGVLPGSTPAAMGPNAHSVSGYARRNPAAPTLGASPKQGGDTTPADNRDHADAIATYADLAGLSEAAYQQQALDRLQASGKATPAMVALLEQLIVLAQADEVEAHEAGRCDVLCPHTHVGMTVDDFKRRLAMSSAAAVA